MNARDLWRVALILWMGSTAIGRADEKAPESGSLIPVGVAKIDITPGRPVRLSGYSTRRTEAESVSQRLWAKAMAIGSDSAHPAILITVDNCGVSAAITDEVAARLKKKAGIRRSCIAICSSHTHSAPMLNGVLPLLFSEPIPLDQQRRIDGYTATLTDRLEQVALAALNARRPAQLDWTVGRVTFAINRRRQGGPVDHSLPMLRVRDAAGKLQAVLVRYACHAVTLVPPSNTVHGDWVGCAQEAIERNHPGVVAMVAIGCAGDAKPRPQGSIEFAQQEGNQIAAEVDRLLQGKFKPVRGPLTARRESIRLPFDRLPTRKEWLERSKSKHRPTAYHATVQLERLARGEQLATGLDYAIQTWTFGRDLAMVFLPGEVVGDYAVRFNRLFDASKLWINAYANDVPCYIPSERVLREGGYEPDRSMLYYGRPTRFAAGIEDRITSAVQRLLPHHFYSAETQREFPPAQSPSESLSSFKTKPGLRVELVAAEPLVIDPVAIDFGLDGRLWVVEYRDYPSGIDGRGKPGGRVVFLEDVDQDGKYDRSTLFLDHVPFPTGIMEWREGVLIAAAPDILYAEDTDGDGRADVRRVLYHGFDTSNFQARVNGFRFGLDNWVHGSGGLYGGTVVHEGKKIPILGRDFRFRPDTGEIEGMTGRSQYGRIRDDWGNWFGNRNSSRLLHFPFPERYLKRNPYAAPPPIEVYVPAGRENVNRIYPISRTLMRFNNPLHFNRVTSACGPTLYRDTLLGEDYYGNAFICQPVHNLVTRLRLEPKGVTFAGVRAADELQSEFLASTDNWFRPAQVRTGPDGGLWVVDMYRFVIEHPKWIGPDRLAKLDVRAGDDRGRIYRIVPEQLPARPAVDLKHLKTLELVQFLDSPNGTLRDLVQRELFQRQDRGAVGTLEAMVRTNRSPAVRLQALWCLEGLQALKPDLILRRLSDRHPAIRRAAIRLSEPLLESDEKLRGAVLDRVDDPELTVRYQLALSLGNCRDPRAGRALSLLAKKDGADPYVSAAVLSSALPHLTPLLEGLVNADSTYRGSTRMLGALARMAVSVGDEAAATTLIRHAIWPSRKDEPRLDLLAAFLDSVERKDGDLERFYRKSGPDLKQAVESLREVFDRARVTAADGHRKPEQRVQAIAVLGRGRTLQKQDRNLLGILISPEEPLAIQLAAIAALGRLGAERTPEMLFADWRSRGPKIREAILDVILRRPEWTLDLLEAVEQGQVRAAELGATRRSQLISHTDARISKRAVKLLRSAEGRNRARVLEAYREALSLKSDIERGRQVFVRVCQDCHHFRGAGKKVGPDLDTITDRSPQALLISLLDPNRAVESKYLSYAARTTDGRVFTGRLVDETSTSIRLLGPKEESHLVLRADLEELAASGKSLMPEGLENDLRPQDVADLIAYLRSAGPVRKSFPGNQPQVVQADSGGNITCLPLRAEYYGPTLQPGTYQRVPVVTGWKSVDDRAAWKVEVDKPGEYMVWLDRVVEPGMSGRPFALMVGSASEPALQAVTRETKTDTNWFRARNLGKIKLQAGIQQISLRALEPIKDNLFHLRSITLVPVAEKD